MSARPGNASSFPVQLSGFTEIAFHRRVNPKPECPKDGLGDILKKPSGAPPDFWDNGFGTEIAPETRAPNRCCHRTNPTVSASSLTTIAGGQCRPALPATLARMELVDHQSAERRAGRWGQDADAGRFRAGRRRLPDGHALAPGGTSVF